jgi:hypothetical protein
MDDIQQQSIRVTFNYPVIFTTNLFAPENPTLGHVFDQRPADSAARVLFIVDRGVADAQPDLLNAIERSCARNPDLDLAGPPLVIDGGEPAKTDPPCWLKTTPPWESRMESTRSGRRTISGPSPRRPP